ncbi:MAG: nucleotidyltransferase domain-containing protein [Gammaproteobacteria bacterium]|nr:MAG: nucleotidyltransferase domain-containing protein [Gammaproteobacteria bacterium]
MNHTNNDPLLKIIKRDIINTYKCHTIILYGSRARGEATTTSDYDILAIRDKGNLERDCRFFEGFYLDVFIYAEDAVKNPDASLIRIKDGVALCQKDNIGDELLSKVKAIFKAGPPATPSWEKQEINAWVMKMLDRAKQGDIEGNFRKHWLLHDLLECYFKLRDAWYLGPKESFQWLKNNDMQIYGAFNEALKPNATFDEIEKLIMFVRN